MGILRVCAGCGQLSPTQPCEPCRAERKRRRNAAAEACAAQVAAEPRCEDCGATEDLTADHRWPMALGGSDRPANLVTKCRSHNAGKGPRPQH